MVKNDFVTLVSENCEASKSQISEVMKGIEKALEIVVANEDEVNFCGLIQVKGVKVDAKTARNPMTGEKVNVPAKSGVPKLKVLNKFKKDTVTVEE